MPDEEKSAETTPPFKVVVNLRGDNAKPESFVYRDQRNIEHTARTKEGAVARALAVVFAKFRCLNRPSFFRVTLAKQGRVSGKRGTQAPAKSNSVRLILNAARDAGRTDRGEIYHLANGDFLRLFRPPTETGKEYMDVDVDQLSPAQVCIRWNGETVTDAANLEILAQTIAAKANPPWELADYTFESESTCAATGRSATTEALPATMPRIPDAIPAPIQKLLHAAEELTDGDQFADAIPILEKALKAAGRGKHVAAEVKTRIRLSKAVFEANEDFAAGEEHCRKALALLGTESSINRHTALHGLGDMLLWAGRMDEAGAVIRSSLDVARSLGDQDSVARSLISVSLLERSLGNGSEAAVRLDEAIQILHQLSIGLEGEKLVNNAHALGVCYANKAQLARDEGRPDEAVAHFAKAQEQYALSNDKLNSGKAHLLLGNLHCGNGDAEEGFQSFKRAMAVFLELKNQLWMARTTKAVAKLNAQHDRWEEAAKAALTAMHGFEEAKATEEHIESTLFAAGLLARLVRWGLRQNIQKQIHDMCKDLPKEHEAMATAGINAQMPRVHAEIDEKVRTDEAIGGLLQDAKALAEKKRGYELLADCYLAEASLRIAKDDTDARKPLLEKALDALRKALTETNVPKHKAQLMGRIGSLCRELGRKSEWASWVKRVGEVFERTGDVYGIANYYCEMAGVHRSQGRLTEQISSERKVLELIEGRSFYDLAAAARINLAEGLRLRREFGEALHQLTEAEAICEVHKMQGMINKIARIRSEIEEASEAGQAAQHTLPQMLCSLHQLVRYKPQDATSYLAFWYFAWKTELMAVLRSGPGVTFMAVTDDAERFMNFARRFSNLGEHFAMVTTTEPTVAANTRTLAIPSSWRFPATFPFVGVRRVRAESGESVGRFDSADDDGIPSINIAGPVRMLPPYMLMAAERGEGRVAAMDTPHLPVEALRLMLERSVKDLVRQRAVWFPSPRHDSDDPFLTDLRVAYERGLFPTFFDRLPTSNDVTVVGSVRVDVPESALTSSAPAFAAKWKRCLLKLTRLSKAEANAALLDLPDSLPHAESDLPGTQLEVHLFEFTELGLKVIHPALLIR